MEASLSNKLSTLQAASIKAARIKLSTIFDLESIDPGKGYVEAWRIKVGLKVCEYLEVKIPRGFPLALPHIFLDRHDLFGILSHVNRDGQFCYFEQDAVTYDVERIADVVEHAVVRSVEALASPDGLTSDDEFRKEIRAYLKIDRSFLTLLRDYDTPRLVSLTRMKESTCGNKFMVAEHADEASRWLKRTGLAEAESTSTAIFIPEAMPGRPPFAGTLRELAVNLKEISPERYSFFAKCFRQAETCITTVTSSLGITVLAWNHGRSRFADPARAPKVSGFRPGRYPAELELSSGYADAEVKYFYGDRVDLERLAARTDPELVSGGEKRVVIVGLGAIGSNLARMLHKAAICSHLALFDGQALGVENVLRHASPFRSVGYPKSAIAHVESLHHAPWTDVECFGDAITEIDQFEKVCKEASLVILATGSERVDAFLAEVAYSHMEPGSAVAQIWLEQRAEVGRIVCYSKRNGPCPSCGKVGRKTIDLAAGTREPGCNASYANYGGSRLQRFCATGLDYILHSKRSIQIEWVARSGEELSTDVCSVTISQGRGCDLCRE